LAVLVENEQQTEVFVSQNCGETLESKCNLQFIVDDITWIFRDRVPVLMFASEVGVYELTLQEGSSLVQVLVDSLQPNLGFKSIATSCDLRGHSRVAVAADNEAGIFLSIQEGRTGTFEPIGLDGELLSKIMIQHIGPHCYLWSGTAAPGRAAGKGCFRIRLTDEGADDIDGWQAFNDGWKAGSCRSLCSSGTRIFAGSLRLGVLWLDTADSKPAWQAPQVDCGLPLRDVGRLQPVNSVMSSEQLILAGGPKGLFKSGIKTNEYSHCSNNEFENAVSLPLTWVFTSGEHKINVRQLDE